MRPGDEIIMPNRSWIATAHAAYVLGAKPILIETTRDQLIKVENIERRITKKTKVIVPVHMNGKACNIKKIIKIANKHKLKVLEDACQAFMSKHQNNFLGTYGDIGCFSFGNTKLLNNIQGGFITTNNHKYFKKLKLIKNHGVYDNFSDKWNQPGFNFKYNEIQSFIGLNNLHFVNSKIKNVNKIYYYYKSNIKNKNFEFLNKNFNKKEVPLYVQVYCKKKGFINYMKNNKIMVRPLPPSISSSRYLGEKSKSLKKLDSFLKSCYYLPCGPDIKLKDVKKVTTVINKFT